MTSDDRGDGDDGAPPPNDRRVHLGVVEALEPDRATWPRADRLARPGPTSSTPRARPALPRASSSATPPSPPRSAATSDALGLGADTRTLCVSPFHFDGSFATLFPTLFSGGAVVIRPAEAPAVSPHVLQRHGIGRASPTPVSRPATSGCCWPANSWRRWPRATSTSSRWAARPVRRPISAPCGRRRRTWKCSTGTDRQRPPSPSPIGR